MPPFKVRSNLIHNNNEYTIGSIIELSNEEAAPLIKVNAIEHTKEKVPEAQPVKSVETFSAPTSHAEVEKIVNSGQLAPATVRRGKCPNCKTEREIRSPQIFQNETGHLRMVGECGVCGTRMSRTAGRVKIEKLEEKKKHGEKIPEPIHSAGDSAQPESGT